jgi:hypothetical protein
MNTKEPEYITRSRFFCLIPKELVAGKWAWLKWVWKVEDTRCERLLGIPDYEYSE